MTALLELLETLHSSVSTKECVSILHRMTTEAHEASSSVNYNLTVRRALVASVKEWAIASHAASSVCDDLHNQKNECVASRDTGQNPALYESLLATIDSTLAHADAKRIHWDAVVTQSLVTITAIDTAITLKLNKEFTDLLTDIEGTRSGDVDSPLTADGGNQLLNPE